MVSSFIALIVGIIVVVVLVVLFWPGSGLVHRWKKARRMTGRVLREDALKHIHRSQRTRHPATIPSVAGDLGISTDAAAELLTEMNDMGLIETQDGELMLTPDGQEAALHIIRAHRLWERYLADETGYGEVEWHGKAEQLEHVLAPLEVDALSSQLGNPTHDPHGDPIPSAGGEMKGHGGETLSVLEPGQMARIVHLEDEPDVVFAQLLAEGLHLGMDIQIIDTTPQRVRFWADGDEHILAPMLAANITVVPLQQLAEIDSERARGERLTNLAPGEEARVLSISKACRSAERRRLMDLGIIPGVRIEAAFTSPSGDPTAYRVRETLIALRSEQADFITISKDNPEPVQTNSETILLPQLEDQL